MRERGEREGKRERGEKEGVQRERGRALGAKRRERGEKVLGDGEKERGKSLEREESKSVLRMYNVRGRKKGNPPSPNSKHLSARRDKSYTQSTFIEFIQRL